MGHLINPVSTRLGFSTFWISSWSLVNLNMYSYFALLDNIIVELVSYFFYYSSSVDFLSKFGFFFSHFRLLRRGVDCFNIKMFFIPNTATTFSKTFVELENQERLGFAYLLGLRFLKLSSFVDSWIDRRLGQIRERRSLFRLRSPRFFQGESVLRLKERFLFRKSMISWSPKKRRTQIRWFRTLEKICKAGFCAKRIKKKLFFFNTFRHYKKRSVAALSRLLAVYGDLKVGVNTANSDIKNLLIKKFLIVCRQKIKSAPRFLKFFYLSQSVNVKKQSKVLLLSKLKLFKQRFLALVVFSRLRRTTLALSFFNYLSTLYSSFISESLRFLPLSYKPVKNLFKVSINFSLINSFKLLNPQFIARFIAKRLSYGIPLRRVLQPIVTDLTKSIEKSSQLLSGFRIKCSGRFSRAQMASVTIERAGSLSLSSIKNLVSMGYSTAFLRYGACGIKVWVSSNEWSACSSNVASNKLTALKILNAVVLGFTKQGRRLLKPYFYNYLVSFFLVNLFLLDGESATTDDFLETSVLSVNNLKTNDQFSLMYDEGLGLSDVTMFNFLKFYQSFRRRQKEQVILRFKQRLLERRQQWDSGKNRSFFKKRKNTMKRGWELSRDFNSNKKGRSGLNKGVQGSNTNRQDKTKHYRNFFGAGGLKEKSHYFNNKPLFTAPPTTHLGG